jgi:hypothetical protein
VLTPAGACSGTTLVIFGVTGSVNGFSQTGSATLILQPLINKNESKTIAKMTANISNLREFMIIISLKLFVPGSN